MFNHVALEMKPLWRPLVIRLYGGTVVQQSRLMAGSVAVY